MAATGLLLACIAVALASILPLYGLLKEKHTNSLIFAVSTRSMLVEEFLDKAKEAAIQITSRSKIRDALKQYNNNEMDLSSFDSFTTPKLQDVLNLSEFVVGITRLDKKGEVVTRVGLSPPVESLHPLNFTVIKPVLSGTILIENQPHVVVCAPILNREKISIGTDIVLMKISDMLKAVHDYTGLGKTGEIILGELGDDGQVVVFFPNRHKLELNQQPLASGSSKIVLEAFRNAYKPGSDRKIRLIETNKDVVAYNLIESTDWVILVKMNKDEFFEPISRQILLISLVIVFIIIPIGLLGLILLLRPLSNKVLIQVDTLQREITAKENAINKQALAEKELLDEQERLNVTLCSIGDGVITSDLNSRIVLVNKVAEELTGWSQSEAVGKSIQEIFHVINKKTGERCGNPLKLVLAANTSVNNDSFGCDILISREGSQYQIESISSPIYDNSNQLIGIVLVFRDVTESRRTAEELLKIEKLESVGMLAGGIAHDFNNILAVILGNLELAEMSLDPESEAYSLMGNSIKASLRARDLTQQLLTFSKGGQPIKKTTTIDSVVLETAKFVLHGSSVSYKCIFPDDLWLVDIDPGQIAQVIQNLVINAKHAMPDGGTVIINCSNIENFEVDSSLDLPSGNYIKIDVIDNGFGIEEKNLKKIFDPYFTTKGKGSGLGLSISHSIISKHNGGLYVKSQKGEGTTFTIYLPASNQKYIDKSEEGVRSSFKVKAKILVMDDEELVLDIAKEMLNHLGHDVLLVQNGYEAIDIYKDQLDKGDPVDVVIMDLTVPGNMGGKEAVQEILKINNDALVIVSSGYSNDPIMANYREYGFKAAIAKPFMLAELRDILISVLK